MLFVQVVILFRFLSFFNGRYSNLFKEDFHNECSENNNVMYV